MDESLCAFKLNTKPNRFWTFLENHSFWTFELQIRLCYYDHWIPLEKFFKMVYSHSYFGLNMTK